MTSLELCMKIAKAPTNFIYCMCRKPDQWDLCAHRNADMHRAATECQH